METKVGCKPSSRQAAGRALEGPHPLQLLRLAGPGLPEVNSGRTVRRGNSAQFLFSSFSGFSFVPALGMACA